MPKLPQHMQSRNGRYYARLVVPAELRDVVGQREFAKALGADYREAKRKLPIVLGPWFEQLAKARRHVAGDSVQQVTGANPAYPMTHDQLAQAHYIYELESDAVERRHSDYDEALVSFSDDAYSDWRGRLERAASGRMSQDEMAATIGWAVDRFKERDNVILRNAADWKHVAMLLARTQLEALDRRDERNRGNWNGTPSNPALRSLDDMDEATTPAPIKKMFEDYMAERLAANRGKAAHARWTPAILDFIAFVGHDDAKLVTKKDIVRWKDSLLEKRLAPTTIKSVYLAALNATFRWGAANDRITDNPSRDVRFRADKPTVNREKGFRDDEALAILRAAKAYKPTQNEKPCMANARKWVSLLCAHTGARVGEIAQLRKQDIFQADGRWVIRITPEAGSTKTQTYRTVPLHKQLLDEGFPEFVERWPRTYLFADVRRDEKPLSAIRSTTNRIREWLISKKLIPDGLQPNHAWRHRFKTVGREFLLNDRVLDAIQGHKPRSASDNYGDVSLKAMANAIDHFPPFDI